MYNQILTKKKLVILLLVTFFAVSSLFAGFSGKATVGLGYNWDTKEYGFSNGTGFDVNVDLASAEADKVAEGDIYAGIKATMSVKVANKSAGSKGIYLWDSADKGAYGAGLFLKVAEAYVAGENWKVSITGTEGATSYAKSFTTHKEKVKDVFGNKTTDEKDVADDVTGDFFSFNKTPGIIVEAEGFKVSIGFKGSENEAYEAEYKDLSETASGVYSLAADKSKHVTGKFLNYNVLVETPAFDFNGLKIQTALGASRKVDNYNSETLKGEFDLKTIVGKSYPIPQFHQIALNASAKADYVNDTMSLSIAADFDMIQYGKSSEVNFYDDSLFNYFDTSVKASYGVFTGEMYFGYNGLVDNYIIKQGSDKKFRDNAKTLNAQLITDLSSKDIPVKLTVWGKDILNTKDIGGKVEVTNDTTKLSLNGGYIYDVDNTKNDNPTSQYYVGSEVEYTTEKCIAKAGLVVKSKVGVANSARLTLEASIESDVVIPGANLKLAYGKTNQLQNILDGQILPQKLGKLEATCTIKF